MSVRLGSFGATRASCSAYSSATAKLPASRLKLMSAWSVAIAGMAHQVLFQDRHCPGSSHGGRPAVTARIDRKSVRGPHSPRFLPRALWLAKSGDRFVLACAGDPGDRDVDIGDVEVIKPEGDRHRPGSRAAVALRFASSTPTENHILDGGPAVCLIGMHHLRFMQPRARWAQREQLASRPTGRSA
jgi:hypothetical protein